MWAVFEMGSGWANHIELTMQHPTKTESYKMQISMPK